MNIRIKNMICLRCKMAVQAVLERHNIEFSSIELGNAKLLYQLTDIQLGELDKSLKCYGLELMGDRKLILVEQIKIIIVDLFHSNDDKIKLKFSEHLSKTLFHDYTYLANVFSETEGSTIERFYIVNRVERAKEMILYEGQSITEIAYLLNFSSVSHLCLQFKKITGYTRATFRKLCESDAFIWRTCD